MKRSKVFEQILNGLVLLGSLAIIIVASIELLDGNNALSETFILKFHLWVCGLFLADFFVRWYTDGWTGRFLIITSFSCWSRFLTLTSCTVFQPLYPIPRG